MHHGAELHIPFAPLLSWGSHAHLYMCPIPGAGSAGPGEAPGSANSPLSPGRAPAAEEELVMEPSCF